MESITYLAYGLFLIAVNSVLLALWVSTKKHIFGILLAVFWLWYLISESQTYGSFWTDFHTGEIVSEVEDSDLNRTVVGWRSEKGNFFTIKELTDFAAANEWNLSDSLVGSYDSLKILFDRFDKFDSHENDFYFVLFKDHVFEQMVPGNYHIYFFATHVQAVSIATTDMTIKNGFAVVNDNGKLLTVYHFWGEI